MAAPAVDLSAKDIEKAKFAFSIYDFEGNNTVDAVDLGHLLRALEVIPTQQLVKDVGGTKKKGEKKLKIDDFLPIYSQVKKNKDVGNYADFIEVLRLYDKESDGTMVYEELKHILLSLGEKLDDAETAEILKDCCPQPDEEGFMPFKPFVDKLMAGPVFDVPKKK